MPADKSYYFSTYVAGRAYAEADDAWPLMQVGMSLILRREPDNPADRHAIAVYISAGEDSKEYKLGYIPVANTIPLAQFLDMGWTEPFEATISRLDPTAPYDRQIGLTVRIIRRQIREIDEDNA